MLCPLLPGVSDGPGYVDRLVAFVLGCGAEEVFVEPVDGRGPCLGDTEEALRANGFRAEADALAAVRHGGHTQWGCCGRCRTPSGDAGACTS